MSDAVTRLRTIEDFSVAEVTAALESFPWTPKSRALVTALASAPDRAMSRYELARVIGSDNVNSCNSTFGSFGKKLALQLDPRLKDEWKPEPGKGGDWVVFLCACLRRWTPKSEGESDEWVFVMRETLARALDAVGITPYVEISEEAWEALAKIYSPELASTD